MLEDCRDDYNELRPNPGLANQTPVELSMHWGGSPDLIGGSPSRPTRAKPERTLFMTGGKPGPSQADFFIADTAYDADRFDALLAGRGVVTILPIVQPV